MTVLTAGRPQHVMVRCHSFHRGAASRTSILPVTAAEIRAVRNSLR